MGGSWDESMTSTIAKGQQEKKKKINHQSDKNARKSNYPEPSGLCIGEKI